MVGSHSQKHLQWEKRQLCVILLTSTCLHVPVGFYFGGGVFVFCFWCQEDLDLVFLLKEKLRMGGPALPCLEPVDVGHSFARRKSVAICRNSSAY